MGAETKLLQTRPNSTQARKGMRRGHPELAVECPQCHSPIGRTCFMGPGYWGITHVLRKLRYREESVAQDIRAAAAMALFLRGWRDNPSTDIDSAMNRKAIPR
jgi:hypothetical protein